MFPTFKAFPKFKSWQQDPPKAAMPYSESSSSADPPTSSPANPTAANVTRTAIPVILTSVRDPTDQRHLTITYGDPTLIGRASRSESKNLQALPTNALFDCPVISREHAELKATPWPPAGDQITITDKGSMHGTHVNGRKLERFKPMSLRSGDLLQFGTRVTRGHDTHDGVVVTFDRVLPDTQNSHTLAGSSPVANRGYKVPEVSDNESDDGSEDAISIISDYSNEEEHGESSAKTTPEQPKSQLGSAQQPIDLENMAPPPRPLPRSQIIDLADDDDDEELSYSPKSPSLPPRPTVLSSNTTTYKLVEDSVDKNADIIIPESIPATHLHSLAKDDEDVLHHNTGLTGLLNDGIESSSERDEDSEPSEMYDEEIEHWADEMDDEIEDEDAEEADRRSDSDASDASYGPLDAAFEEYETNSYSAKKQLSPELGSAIPAKQAPPFPPPAKGGSGPQLNNNYVPIPYKPATQPYYDPVRASQPMKAPIPSSMDQLGSFKPWSAASQGQPYRPYVYGCPASTGPSGASVNVHTDGFSSSRWDQPPPPPPPVNDFHSQPAYSSTLNSHPFGDSFYQNPYVPVTTGSMRFHQQQPFTFVDDDWSGEAMSASVPLTSGSTSFPAPEQPVVEPTSPTTKNRMKISEMVEKTADAAKEVVAEVEEPLVSVSKKRKAEEMTGDDSFTLNLPVEPTETASMLLDQVFDDLDGVREPPARRRKIEETTTKKDGRSVAGDMAKYAAAAAVGGVSTVAFLCSPLAERLLEWLA